MPTAFSYLQNIQQLEKRKGGYYYLQVEAQLVDQLPKGRSTRLICEIDRTVSYSCGLNHLGDGNYFIIIATKYLKKIGKELGDEAHFKLSLDPNPLGVEIPEVLLELLEQEPQAKRTFDQITDGKKRSLIYQIKPLKNVDRQVEVALDFLEKETAKINKRKK